MRLNDLEVFLDVDIRCLSYFGLWPLYIAIILWKTIKMYVISSHNFFQENCGNSFVGGNVKR